MTRLAQRPYSLAPSSPPTRLGPIPWKGIASLNGSPQAKPIDFHWFLTHTLASLKVIDQKMHPPWRRLQTKVGLIAVFIGVVLHFKLQFDAEIKRYVRLSMSLGAVSFLHIFLVFAHGAQEQPFPLHNPTGLLHVLDCDGAKSQTLKVSQFSPKSFKTEYVLNVTNGSWCLFLSIRSILVFYALILTHIILQDHLPTKLELMMNILSRNEPMYTIRCCKSTI